MSSLSLPLTHISTTDIEKLSKTRPKHFSNRKSKRFFFRNTPFLLKLIIPATILLLIIIPIKYRITTINTITTANANHKLKIATLNTNIAQLTSTLSALTTEFKSLEMNKETLLVRHSESMNAYDSISHKIKELESQKSTLNNQLSGLISQSQSLQMQMGRRYNDYGLPHYDNYGYPISPWNPNMNLSTPPYAYPYNSFQQYNNPYSLPYQYGIMGKLRLNEDPFTHYRFPMTKYNDYNGYPDKY